MGQVVGVGILQVSHGPIEGEVVRVSVSIQVPRGL